MTEFHAHLSPLLQNQKLGVLATVRHGYPYTSLVAFSVSDDTKKLYFATLSTTRKYENLKKQPQANMLIDSRSHQSSDFFQAAAVSAVGTVSECSTDQLHKLTESFLKKHPALKDFVTADTCVMMCLKVEKYILVHNFQEVTEWAPRQ